MKHPVLDFSLSGEGDSSHDKLYRLKTILVPVDLSEGAGNALRFAWNIATTVGADIEVLHVMDAVFEGEFPPTAGFLAHYPQILQKDLDEFIEKTLHDRAFVWAAEKIMPGGVSASDNASVPYINATILTGFPDSVIEEQSAKADLIIMGTTGKTALSKRLFGSISIEVSKFAHCPALFIPEDTIFRPFKNVLYASNFESLDVVGIRQATAFAQRFDSQIHFVHVGPAGEEGIAEQRALFEEKYTQAHPEQPFIFCKMVENESIMEGLYEYAFYHHVDLLIFVTHHRNFWEDMFHKSVTQKALLNSDIPILVMHK